MKGRDILKGMVNLAEQAKIETPATASTHKPAGAVRAMNLSLDRLKEQAASARGLSEAIAAGDKVVDLDPTVVEMAFIQDRIPLEIDPELDMLTASIRENGQQVPILVRPHPTLDNHYQAAYGHRRLRALVALGRPVRAVVRKLTDEDVILAQGQENGLRVDLSFIERALFASRMEKHGFDRGTIAKALSVDKPETSRLLQVADCLGQDLILAIGPAPKIGRPRWLAFADLIKNPDAAKRAADEIRSAGFASADSNSRFDRLWKAMQEPSAKKAKQVTTIRTKKGLQLATFERGPRGSKLALTSDRFTAFLSDRMPDLVAAFEQEMSEKTNH